MLVEIDKNSGFCFGVVNAIRKAEAEVALGELYCIGDIVHNDCEVRRLKNMGLKTIDHERFAHMHDVRVLFRAHGEPPESYRIAQANNIEIIDASCPVVLKLQRKIREAYQKMKKVGGQVIIYGKHGHAEVVGLVGQTNGEAVVIESEDDLEKLDYSKPMEVFSQTTKSLEGFEAIACRIMQKRESEAVIHDTICRKVANRIPQLRMFAKRHDVILFVSGEKSSNGKQLFGVCKETNPKTWFIQGANDVCEEMFEDADSVGISGATSTPLWIMEEVRDRIMELVIK